MANQTLAQIEYAIRSKLNSLTTRRFSHVAVVTWVNEALDDLARRTEALRSSSTVAISAGTQSVTAPEGAIRVHMVLYHPTGDDRRYDLEYRDVKSMSSIAWTRTYDTDGTPAIWWTWGYPPTLSVYVYPTPTISGNLEIYYYKTATSLATDGSAAATAIDVPSGWEDAITDYATFQALLSDSDERFQVYKQMYDDKIAALIQASTRYTDQLGSIDTGYSLVPGFLWDEGWDW